MFGAVILFNGTPVVVNRSHISFCFLPCLLVGWRHEENGADQHCWPTFARLPHHSHTHCWFICSFCYHNLVIKKRPIKSPFQTKYNKFPTLNSFGRFSTLNFYAYHEFTSKWTANKVPIQSQRMYMAISNEEVPAILQLTGQTRLTNEIMVYTVLSNRVPNESQWCENTEELSPLLFLDVLRTVIAID